MSEFFLDWFLGMGGLHPGVLRIPPEEGEALRLLDLPSGHSVYALDLDPQNRHMAAGTRDGRIEILALPRDNGTGAEVVASLEQGAPVLSVCFVGDGRLAATDTRGRCLLWEPFAHPHTPSVLKTKGETICSLLSLPEGGLLGLSSRGQLLRWEIQGEKLVAAVAGPAPPAKLALVNTALGPKGKAAAYPGADGSLVLCDLASMQLQSYMAHRDGFYAVFTLDQEFCTVGASDSLIKGWSESTGSLSWQCRAPANVIAGRQAGTRGGQVLLITRQGQAQFCALEAGQLRLQQTLGASECRTVAAVLPQIRRDYLHGMRTAKARLLLDQIQKDLVDGRTKNLEPLLGEMEILGYQATSLELRARQAALDQNLMAELQARRTLIQILSDNAPGTRESLDRYADVLEKGWQVHEALAMRNRSAPADRDSARNWLLQTSQCMRDESWIAQADVPVPTLLQAATMVGQPFAGRWVLQALGNIPIPEARLSPGDIVDKYHRVKAEDGRAGLPVATTCTVPWLSRQMPRVVPTMFLDGLADQATEGLEVAVQILQDGLGTVLLPFAVFRVRPRRAEEPVEEHNRHVAQDLARIGEPAQSGPWIREVLQIVYLALRELRTQAMCRWSA